MHTIISVMNKETTAKILTVIGWIIGIGVAYFLATAWPTEPAYECETGDGTTITSQHACD